ncbi:MAG: hypothetical protein ACOX7J_07780 [Bacillota bacterium]
MPETYRLIPDYAKENCPEPYDCAYEEVLNEMALQKRADYITMITIPVKKQDYQNRFYMVLFVIFAEPE